jgi:hypothetical protein
LEEKMFEAITIQLDKERHMLLDLDAMIKFQEVTGKNLLVGANMGEFTPKDLRALLWAALLREDPALKLEDAGKFCIDLTYIDQKVGEAIRMAMPPKKDESPSQ